MSNLYLTSAAQPQHNLPDNERITRLREKLYTVQKSLTASQEPRKDNQRLFEAINYANLTDESSKNNLSTTPSNKGTNIFQGLYSNRENFENAKLLNTNDSKFQIFKNILEKVNAYKLNPFGSDTLIDTLHTKFDGKNQMIYNFSEEENIKVLRFLISLLYQELELSWMQNPNKNIKNLKENLQDLEKENRTIKKTNKELLYQRNSPSLGLGNISACCRCKSFIEELKDHLFTLNKEVLYSQQVLTEDSVNYYYEIAKTINDKFKYFESELYNQQLNQTNSIADLFQNTSSNRTYQRQESSLKTDNEMREIKQFRGQNIQELLDEVNELKKENERLRKRSESKSKSPRGINSAKDSNPLIIEELKRTVQDKENLEIECSGLKKALQGLERQLNEIEGNCLQMNKANISKMDLELTRARNQIISLINQKASAEKQTFKIRVEYDDLSNKLYAYGSKLKELANQNEILKLEAITKENQIKEKVKEIQKLNYIKSELENKYCKLKKFEVEYEQSARLINTLGSNIDVLRGELSSSRLALSQAEEDITSLVKEKDVIITRCEALENFDPREASSNCLEQIAILIFSRLIQGNEINIEFKNKVQRIFGEKFVHLLSPLKRKIKRIQSKIKELRAKYKQKINDDVDKTHEIENLSCLLLKVYETLDENVENHSPTSLILLKDDSQRKSEMLLKSIEKHSQAREINLHELRKFHEEDEEENYDSDDVLGAMLNQENESGPSQDADQFIEENITLKAKCQEQTNEILALNAQIKFIDALEGKKRRNTLSRVGYQTDRQRRSSRDLINNKEIDCKDSEGVKMDLNRVVNYDDIYLMLCAQASSIELLISNTE